MFTASMEHLLEVLKILDGAVTSDRRKVVTYAEQLATKLEASGDPRAAASVRKALRRASGGAELSAALVTPTVPIDSESRLSLADEQHYSPADVCVYLDDPAESRVAEFVRYVKASDRLIASGVGIAPSLLAYGPPGTGKSKLAKHVSAHLDLPLLTARTDALVSSYLGSTSKNLRLLFDHAMSRPCVLFLDEFDAVAKLRDDRHELGELKRVVVSLLQNIDALDSKTVLVAATNHHHLLDPAIWRRFAFRVELALPTVPVRRRLFERFLGPASPPELDLDHLALGADGLSGADIRTLCEDARRAAVLAGNEHVGVNQLLIGLVRAQIRGFDVLPAEDRVRAARKLSTKLFTVRRLSEMFDASTGKVSMLLREGDG